jgi:YNFM family putative membrane transporter
LAQLTFTFGFFGSYAIASSWIGRCAKTAKGQATSLYQIFFYAGASAVGTWGGAFGSMLTGWVWGCSSLAC